MCDIGWVTIPVVSCRVCVVSAPIDSMAETSIILMRHVVVAVAISVMSLSHAAVVHSVCL